MKVKYNEFVIAAFYIVVFVLAYLIALVPIYKQKATTETTTAAETTAIIETMTEAETEPELIPLGKFKLTAYCPCVKCCGKSDGITASGSEATEGRTIAVDPSKIPYGTQLVINGHTYIAEDCGGAVKGNSADIFFNSHADALAFGVQYADVYAVNASLCNE